MMELTSDISRYANEFKKTVLLLDGQSDPAAQECDLAQVCYWTAPISFLVLPEGAQSGQ